MKHFLFYTLTLVAMCMSMIAQTIQYISPKPNSKWNALETSIIIRQGEPIDQSTINGSNLITVFGSKSGIHTGSLILSSDNKMLMFKPDVRFDLNENVNVAFTNGIKTTTGKSIEPFSFRFSTIERIIIPAAAQSIKNTTLPTIQTTGELDTIPADYPTPIITNLDNPAPGYFILAPYGDQRPTGSYGNYLMVLDNNGKTISYKRNGSKLNNIHSNFKQNQNGLLGFVDRNPNMTAVRILDSTLSVIDSFPGGNGQTLVHGNFELLPNGHTILVMYDSVLMDLSKTIKGGNPNAKVMLSIIQELDLDKNIVFQWRSIDYIPIADSYDDSTSSSISHVDMTNVIIDNDGNFLASNRYLSEITKINHETGEIIWRLGGKNNQFSFIGEHQENAPLYFSFQNDIHRLANGNITLYDNGNLRMQKYSRAVEYKLDEVNRTATLVWEYRHTPDIYANSNGNVQRLLNGNTLICWGHTTGAGIQALTEVHPDNSIAAELTLPDQVSTTNAFKVASLNPSMKAAQVTREVFEGNTYSFNDTGRYACTKMIFNQLERFFYSMVHVIRYEYAPINVEFNGKPPLVAPVRFVMIPEGIISFDAEVRFVLSCFSGITDPSRVVIFFRPDDGSGVFTPLPTQYDAAKNELVTETDQFGEFIFGVLSTSAQVRTPFLLSPQDHERVNQKLPVLLQWTPNGYTTQYQLQVASDSLFNNTIVDMSALKNLEYEINNLILNNTYYWRVKSENDAGSSDWSEVRRFTVSESFIHVQTPNGGELLAQGGSYIIRWDKNISDYVRINLYRNGGFVMTIKDSLTNTGAYLWNIPSSTTIDSTYKIEIVSVADNSMIDQSDNVFTIKTPATYVESKNNTLPNSFYLGQNYPNPFSRSTSIQIDLSPILSWQERVITAGDRVRCSFKVYDIFGREVLDLSNQIISHSSFVIRHSDLPTTGIYFYRLTVGNESQTKMMMFVR